MPRSTNPVNMAMGLPRQQLQWAQSVDETLNGGVSLGTIAPGAKSIDSTGTPANFNRDNSTGILIRIGASGSGNGPLYNWTTTGTGVEINHQLGRQPIGFHVVDSDKPLTVHRTTTSNTQTITLAPSDATANSTVYIF
jgi:hypothetical protein